jgi:hypothetical protein
MASQISVPPSLIAREMMFRIQFLFPISNRARMQTDTPRLYRRDSWRIVPEKKHAAAVLRRALSQPMSVFEQLPGFSQRPSWVDSNASSIA